MEDNKQEFEPFGAEWEKEISRIPKGQIIKWLGNALKKANQERRHLHEAFLAGKKFNENMRNPTFEEWLKSKGIAYED